METHSVSLHDMSLKQLVQLNQGLGRQIDNVREQRRRLKELIAERIAAGESEEEPAEQPQAGADAQAPGSTVSVTTRSRKKG